MGLFNIFKKKDNRNNYTFGDTDRELSAEIRKQKAEYNKARQELDLKLLTLENKKKQIELEADIAEASQRLKEISGYDDEEEEEPETNNDFTSIISAIPMLMQTFNNQNQTPNSNTVSVVTTPPQPIKQELGVSLSDEELQNMYKQIPKTAKAIAKTMSDETLKNYLKGQIPNLDEDTINRAIALVRG